MKAQSAIEYLMTYGWMLLAVAVAGGAAYSTTGGQCVESVNGFTGNSVDVSNFGTSIDSNNISLQVENRRENLLEIQKVEFESGGEKRQQEAVREVEAYKDTVLQTSGFKQSDSCNNIDVIITYELGPLENQKASGTITAPIAFDDTVVPATPDSFDAGYPSLE